MDVFRWVNRHPWGIPALWAVPALILAAVGWDWGVGPVLCCWIPLAAAAVWLRITAMRKEMKQELTALENCDPEPLLQTSRELAKQYPLERPRSRRNGISLLLNVTTALYALGRGEEAAQILDQLEPWVRKTGGQYLATWLFNRAALSLREEKCQQAQQFLEEAERVVRSMTSEERKTSAWEELLERARWQLRFQRKEDLAGLLQTTLQWLERPETLQYQVTDHYHAACCLRALGRTEEAQPHLEFAVKHGGGLEIRRRAMKMLEEIQAPDLQ